MHTEKPKKNADDVAVQISSLVSALQVLTSHVVELVDTSRQTLEYNRTQSEMLLKRMDAMDSTKDTPV